MSFRGFSEISHQGWMGEILLWCHLTGGQPGSPLLEPFQSDFRACHSTKTVLMVNDILCTLDSNFLQNIENHIILMTLLTTTTSSLTSPQLYQLPKLPSTCQKSSALLPTPGNYYFYLLSTATVKSLKKPTLHSADLRKKYRPLSLLSFLSKTLQPTVLLLFRKWPPCPNPVFWKLVSLKVQY